MLQAQENEPGQPLRAGAMLSGFLSENMLDTAAEHHRGMQTGCKGACLTAPC